MGPNIIVTVKQVPDTQNVTNDAMKPDGTVNRAALPTVFNPEDLNALEEALRIKDKNGGHITVLTMGPPKAIDVLKDCLYRGVDDVILLSDRKFAGADTLATSYALKSAIEKIGKYDLIFCGRQAIDGDTAQVGPQIAEKLGINQLTCVFDVLEISKNSIQVKRAIDGGYEIVKSDYPVLLTVTGEANEPRPPSVRKVMAYKNITQVSVEESYNEAYLVAEKGGAITHIKEWNAEVIGVNTEKCGLSGSPTKVKKIQNVVLGVNEIKQVPASKEGIKELMQELTAEHIIG